MQVLVGKIRRVLDITVLRIRNIKLLGLQSPRRTGLFHTRPQQRMDLPMIQPTEYQVCIIDSEYMTYIVLVMRVRDLMPLTTAVRRFPTFQCSWQKILHVLSTR